MLDLDAYFARIGYQGPWTPTLDTLRALQAQHPLAIPFENLDSLAGRGVCLDSESLQQKLVRTSRGGYCFEQNLLFSHVLRALGFSVTALAARVVWDRPADEVRARTHMLLLVDLDGERYLCDVGFGGLTPTAPLKLAPGLEQPTPHETFRVLAEAPEFVVQARAGSAWKPLYRFDLQPQELVDIELLNFYVAGHADSPMLGRLIAARVAPDRRYGLRNGLLSVHHLDGRHEQQRLTTVGELRDVLTRIFGIAVPADAGLDAAFATVLA
ncbi:MAG TPA: arylamine N-acetyltransferase [Gammaproteobacteria bacterium]|jgi:N-hydroxyarylamine O-acetyltransferase|nr:arylamine N-acetyltransferase [Gammaproteobacteria bacterium]